jgi:hypothetical protein
MTKSPKLCAPAAIATALLLPSSLRAEDAAAQHTSPDTAAAQSVARSVPRAAFALVPPALLAPNPCELPYLIDARGIQRLLPHCLGLETLSLALPAMDAAPSFTRTPPFPCDVPYRVDESGIRRLILQCPLEVARAPEQNPAPRAEPAASGCDLPYKIDEAGIRRVRPECLDP